MLCMDMVEYEECDPDVHNPNCDLFCPEPMIETTTFSASTSTRDPGEDKEPYCNGIPIDMYMSGFEIFGDPTNQGQ